MNIRFHPEDVGRHRRTNLRADSGGARIYVSKQLRRIGAFVAQYAVQKYPGLFTVERLKKDRGTKIYIDYLQHWYGKNVIRPLHAACPAGCHGLDAAGLERSSAALRSAGIFIC
ncbi:hypothetical protein [Paenibacillus validus]|uniref:non-homologous end-joining DNA ligase LigD n=1 Tax=Paenibacillus validus TaxID=44253 RepID=UPI003D2C8AAC